MTNTKNNLPLYEDQKQIIEGEQLSIQQILKQFQQLVPTNFVKLSEVSYMCSTNPKWNKPLNIPHTSLEKLELEKGQDIPYPLYISPTILNKKELSFGAYNINNEEEIFIQQPLTINNLEQELTNWLTEIKTLKRQIQELETEKTTNQQTTTDNLQAERNNLVKRITQLDRLLQGSALVFAKQQSHINQLTQQLQKEQNNNINLSGYNDNLRQDLLALAHTRKELQSTIKELFLTQEQIANDRDDYQTKREKEQLENNLQTQINDLNQQLTDLNNLITNIQNLLGINDLNNLPQIPEEETLTSLLARPTLVQLNALKSEIDVREEKIRSLT
ncbi:11653_t:CDS:2, partial [Ambispora gerdemannii]